MLMVSFYDVKEYLFLTFFIWSRFLYGSNKYLMWLLVVAGVVM